MPRSKSQQLYQQACRLMPGGVNSPVRAFGAVGGTPVFVEHAKGSHYWDADGNEYVDYVCSWGPLILGHAHDAVVRAVRAAVSGGTSFGAPTRREIQMAQLITQAFPSIDLVRMVNSGTEAVMSALRVARGYTGRSKVLKFVGCWHGHADGLLVKAGSTGMTFNIPDSAGVPREYAQQTLLAPYNDLAATRDIVENAPETIGAIVVEPVAGNMGVIPPAAGFLEGLRALCDQHGIVLVFDEVITGFRVAHGGAQERYGVKADLTTLGKIVGGGMPVGAYGGRQELMERVAPLGTVVQAGTLSGNPIAMAAGIATLKQLQAEGVYQQLEERSATLERGLLEAAATVGVPVTINRVGSMMTLFFTGEPVTDFDSASRAYAERYARFFHAMLDRGIALPPSKAEAWFISTAHTPEDVQRTVEAAREALQLVAA